MSSNEDEFDSPFFPIIIDIGSMEMKSGWSDNDVPGRVFPTVVGRPKIDMRIWQGMFKVCHFHNSFCSFSFSLDSLID